MKYIIKSATSFHSGFKFNYQKPATCPFCGYGTDATYKDKTYYGFNSGHILLAVCECTSCHKNFFFACEHTKDDLAKTACIYPNETVVPYSNDNLSAISERFIDIYNQALKAEYNGSYELAATGYRSALEILVKDFAINELNEPEETVSKQSLCNAIAQYLKQEELVKTADVVRILGNDYTHYKRKYPEHDFALLKIYMEIFLSQIEAQYMIKHPPVSRN
mgnify:CR=1 FL=1